MEASGDTQNTLALFEHGSRLIITKREEGALVNPPEKLHSLPKRAGQQLDQQKKARKIQRLLSWRVFLEG